MIQKLTTISTKYGEPLLKISEHITKDPLRGTITKFRTFTPVGDHFLKPDGVWLVASKDLISKEKSIVAFLGDPINGRSITSGVENVKKLINSIKQGIHVNIYSAEWAKQVFHK